MRADQEKDLARIRSLTEVSWDAGHTEGAYLRYERYRKRRQRRTRLTQGGLAVTLGLVAGLALWPSSAPHSDPTHRFADGSQARWTSDAEWQTRTESPSLVEVELRRGRGRFKVTKTPDRTFRVRCGAVTAEVLGTTFSVERESDQVRVDVSEGRVRVQGPQGTTVLSAGETLTVSAAPKPEPETETETETPLVAAEAEERPTKRWQRSAKRGDMETAFKLIKRQRVANKAEDLLLAADVARMTGHPDQALPYLRRVVREHQRDPRAPLAAFTLGKLLLEELGQPLRAADAFRKVGALKASSDLVEDALAREVECYFRAGDEERARERAERYVQRYPNGARRTLVERYGRLSSR
ncbi:MAG: FecR family protein [Myxococcota bacterium]